MRNMFSDFWVGWEEKMRVGLDEKRIWGLGWKRGEDKDWVGWEEMMRIGMDGEEKMKIWLEERRRWGLGWRRGEDEDWVAGEEKIRIGLEERRRWGLGLTGYVFGLTVDKMFQVLLMVQGHRSQIHTTHIHQLTSHLQTHTQIHTTHIHWITITRKYKQQRYTKVHIRHRFYSFLSLYFQPDPNMRNHLTHHTQRTPII